MGSLFFQLLDEESGVLSVTCLICGASAEVLEPEDDQVVYLTHAITCELGMARAHKKEMH